MRVSSSHSYLSGSNRRQSHLLLRRRRLAWHNCFHCSALFLDPAVVGISSGGGHGRNRRNWKQLEPHTEREKLRYLSFWILKRKVKKSWISSFMRRCKLLWQFDPCPCFLFFCCHDLFGFIRSSLVARFSHLP